MILSNSGNSEQLWIRAMHRFDEQMAMQFQPSPSNLCDSSSYSTLYAYHFPTWQEEELQYHYQQPIDVPYSEFYNFGWTSNSDFTCDNLNPYQPYQPPIQQDYTPFEQAGDQFQYQQSPSSCTQLSLEDLIKQLVQSQQRMQDQVNQLASDMMEFQEQNVQQNLHDQHIPALEHEDTNYTPTLDQDEVHSPLTKLSISKDELSMEVHENNQVDEVNDTLIEDTNHVVESSKCFDDTIVTSNIEKGNEIHPSIEEPFAYNIHLPINSISLFLLPF